MGKQYEKLGITDAFMFAKVMSNKRDMQAGVRADVNI